MELVTGDLGREWSHRPIWPGAPGPLAHRASVVNIAAAHRGERSCATGTTMYVSHSLAMLAIAVHPGSRTTRLIRESGEFSVSFFASRSRRWPARQGSRRQVSMNSQRNIPVQGPPGDL